MSTLNTQLQDRLGSNGDALLLDMLTECRRKGKAILIGALQIAEAFGYSESTLDDWGNLKEHQQEEIKMEEGRLYDLLAVNGRGEK